MRDGGGGWLGGNTAACTAVWLPRDFRHDFGCFFFSYFSVFIFFFVGKYAFVPYFSAAFEFFKYKKNIYIYFLHASHSPTTNERKISEAGGNQNETKSSSLYLKCCKKHSHTNRLTYIHTYNMQ